MWRCLLVAPLASVAGPALASASAPVAAAADPSLAGGMLQVMFALALVLGLIIAAAWLMRRFSLLPTAVGGNLRVVSGIMVGQRERVVIVEVRGQWLVLGVTPQQVNLLTSLPKPEEAELPPPATPPFADWLAKALQKRGLGASAAAPEKS